MTRYQPGEADVFDAVSVGPIPRSPSGGRSDTDARSITCLEGCRSFLDEATVIHDAYEVETPEGRLDDPAAHPAFGHDDDSRWRVVCEADGRYRIERAGER